MVRRQGSSGGVAVEHPCESEALAGKSAYAREQNSAGNAWDVANYRVLR
jgi:hypothetical protein